MVDPNSLSTLSPLSSSIYPHFHGSKQMCSSISFSLYSFAWTVTVPSLYLSFLLLHLEKEYLVIFEVTIWWVFISLSKALFFFFLGFILWFLVDPKVLLLALLLFTLMRSVLTLKRKGKKNPLFCMKFFRFGLYWCWLSWRASICLFLLWFNCLDLNSRSITAQLRSWDSFYPIFYL